MTYAVLYNSPPKSELDHQALEYQGLLGAQRASLSEIRGSTILVFRPLTIQDVKTINEDNKLVFFSDGILPPPTVLVAHAIDCFVTFGSRSAYMLANTLKSMNINKPVYKIHPWINTATIDINKKPPFGKIVGGDLGLPRAMLLMAAGAVVVAPDHSPFNEIIVDGYDGITYTGELTDEKFASITDIDLTKASAIANNAVNKINHLCDVTKCKEKFAAMLAGDYPDHNEPWIKVDVGGGHRWIMPKETMVSGEVTIIPEKFDSSFKIMKCFSLNQIFEYFSRMRFVDAYVFDAIVEPLDNDALGKTNRLLNILGAKSKDIFFCMDAPKEWSAISHKLVFMSASDASKRM